MKRDYVCKCGKESKYPRCSDCNKKYMAEYYVINKKSILEKQKKYNDENKVTIKKRQKIARRKNKEKIAKQKHESYLRNKSKNNLRSAEWYRNNKERAIATANKWKKDNNEKVRNYKTQYDKSKAEESTEYKIKRNLRARLRAALKNNQKKGSAVKDLGCSVENFRNYLETLFYANKITGERMTWNNYGLGRNKWQIDHIKALKFFNLSNKEQFLEAVHYTNLQPLWYEDHIIKTRQDRGFK